MPLYDFLCPSCGRKVEENVSVFDRDLPVLCECSEEMKRLPSVEIRWILKGGGWSRDGKAMRKTRGES